jgi:serine/threonine protein kinase
MEQTITNNLDSTNEQNNSLIFGNYEAVKAIGKGKFAIVYRAHRIGDDQVVALKRISVDMMNDKAREKTLKEVRLLQSLDHPNTIHYMDSFINDNDLIIIYEWAAAGDLKRQIRKAQEKGVGFEERVIWKYFSQIANAMQHMHERRIMHRDLKPANIFLTLDGTIKVGDLGLSREFSEHTHQAHSKVGTPLYMSPEVINGNGYEFKSDIWSLGCLLYELAVLKSPFKSEGINLYSLLNKISSGDYQPIPDNYSEELRNLAHAMISTNPEDRPDIVYICDVAQKMRSFTSSEKGGGKLKRSYSRSEDTMMTNTGGGGGGSGGNEKNNNNEGEGRTGAGSGIAENKTIAPSIRNPNKVEQVQDQEEEEEGRERDRRGGKGDRDRGEKEWRGTPTSENNREKDGMDRRTRTPGEEEEDERGAEEKDRERGREGRASSYNKNKYDNGIGSDHKREMAQTPPSSSSALNHNHNNHNNPNPNPSPRLVGPSPNNPFSKQLSPPPLSASRSSSNPNIHNNPNNPTSQFQVVLPFDDSNQEREEQAKKPSDGVYRRSKPPRPESGSAANKRPPSGQQTTTTNTNNNNSSQSNQRRMSNQQEQFDDEPSTPVTPGTPVTPASHKERVHSASSVSNHLAAALESLSPAFAAMDFLYTKLIILDYPMTDPRLVSNKTSSNKNNKKDKKDQNNNNSNNNSNNSNIDSSLPTSQRARGRLLPIHFACDLQLFSSSSPSSGTGGAGIAGHEPGFQFLQFRRMAEVAVWLCCEKIGGKSAEIAGRIDLDTSNSVTISKQLLLAAQVTN